MYEVPFGLCPSNSFDKLGTGSFDKLRTGSFDKLRTNGSTLYTPGP
jgi:hypothetical protein